MDGEIGLCWALCSAWRRRFIQERLKWWRIRDGTGIRLQQGTWRVVSWACNTKNKERVVMRISNVKSGVQRKRRTIPNCGHLTKEVLQSCPSLTHSRAQTKHILMSFFPSLWLGPLWLVPPSRVWASSLYVDSALLPRIPAPWISIISSLVSTSAWVFFITDSRGRYYLFSSLFLASHDSSPVFFLSFNSFTKVCTTLHSGTVDSYSNWAPNQPDWLHRAHPSLHFPVLKGNTYLGSLLLLSHSTVAYQFPIKVGAISRC